MPCTDNDECTDLATPLCSVPLGECVACDALPDGNAGCAELDPAAPLCVEQTCVACSEENTTVCDEQALVCDTTVNECGPCTAHDQCGEAACNLFDGTCLPQDAVLHVGPGQPLSSIAEAIAMVEEEDAATVVIHGNGSFDEAVVVDGERTVAFVANQDDLPRWLASGAGAPQLTATEGTVLLNGLQLSGNGSTMNPGVLVDGGRVWADRSRIIVNSGGGVVAQAGAELVLRNCFVGDGTVAANALTVDSASAQVVYSTLGNGFDNFGASYAVSCTSPISVVLRNSLLFSLDTEPSEIDCAAADIDYTASESMLPGETNVELGELQADWFTNVTVGDFHLVSPPAAIGNAAQWQDGDPGTDLDGDLRPQTDGVSDFAGADVP